MKYLFCIMLAISLFSCGKTDTNNQTKDESKSEIKKTESKTSNSTEPETVKKTAADFKYDPTLKLPRGYDGGGDDWANEINSCNASTNILRGKDIENMYKDELELIRNLVYARHGYIFKNPEFKAIFENVDWYIPVFEDVNKDLTEVELKNIELIKRYEQRAKKYISIR